MKITVKMSDNPLLQIKNYLTKSFFYQDSAIKPYRKIEQLGLNEMEFNEVIVELENHNQIAIPDTSLKNVVTIGDLVNLINYHRNIAYFSA
jgi:acyl carrier protein